MFALTQQSATLVNVNPRSEIHGDEFKLATDLNFKIKVGNDILNEFHPNLKEALYRAAEAGDDGQGDLLQDQMPGHLPKQRFQFLGPIKWGWSGHGYALTVHYGFSGKSDILMIQTEVDNFRFDCQDGGTVIAAFRVIAHPEPEELGRLCEMIQQEVSISLQPPSLEEQFQQRLDEHQEEEE